MSIRPYSPTAGAKDASAHYNPHMLKRRIVTALLVFPLLFISVWFDKPIPWFTLFAGIWSLLAALEFYNLTSVSRSPSLTSFGLAWTVFFILSTHFEGETNLALRPALLTFLLVLSLVWLVLRREKEGAFTVWAWTIAGVLYIGWLLSYLVALRGLADGRNWVYYALFVTFASDTTAFFIGRTFGHRHLAPNISPKKTWEGAIAGVFGAIVLSLLFTLPGPFQLQGFSYGAAVVLGILVSVFGQFGDLVESLLKRNMGAKESGKLMPGHGGLLDRSDSVLFAGVVVYFYYVCMVA